MKVDVDTGPATRDLRRWGDQLGPAVTKAAEPFADRAADLVRNKVPVLTGQLAGSVEARTDDTASEVSMGDGVPYAGWIEFGGTRGRPYIPEGRYLYPTALSLEDDYAKVAADAADESARRFPWSTSSS